jgi:hypothetical protein
MTKLTPPIRTSKAIAGPWELDVDWTVEPEFDFAYEVDALETLMWLREQLEAAREQQRQVMRYMNAAVKGADAMDEGERPTRQAVIGHSGLARQTVYGILGEA